VTYAALISVAILQAFYEVFSSLGVFVYFFIIIAGSILLGSCIKWLLGVALLPLNDDNLRVIGLTGAGAVFLSASAVFAEEAMRLLRRGKMSFVHIAIVLYLFIVFVLSERAARIYTRRALDVRLETPESRVLTSLPSAKFIRLLAEIGAETLEEVVASNWKTDAITALWLTVPFLFASSGGVFADELPLRNLGNFLSQLGLLDSVQHSLRVIGIIFSPIFIIWLAITAYLFLTTREIQAVDI